jgi:hypothetical protein
MMIYSYSQISQFLSCPRRYRYRYVDGWREKETRPNVAFGRCFEKAVAAYFLREDCKEVFLREWTAFKEAPLEFTRGERWETVLQQGFVLLDRLAQDDRVVIRRPKRHLQVRVSKQLSGCRQFVAYIDAVGWVDGTRAIIDWKTSTCRFPAEPDGVAALDPQLVCYSWITGEPEVALVVFVRKHLPEIQYLRATISDDQRRDFGQLARVTIERIESGEFHPQGDIRSPDNGCTRCSYLGLCLPGTSRTGAPLVNLTGGQRGWADELDG